MDEEEIVVTESLLNAAFTQWEKDRDAGKTVEVDLTKPPEVRGMDGAYALLNYIKQVR